MWPNKKLQVCCLQFQHQLFVYKHCVAISRLFFAVGKCLVDKRKALAKADECFACGDSCEAEEDEAVVDEK